MANPVDTVTNAASGAVNGAKSFLGKAWSYMPAITALSLVAIFTGPASPALAALATNGPSLATLGALPLEGLVEAAGHISTGASFVATKLAAANGALPIPALS